VRARPRDDAPRLVYADRLLGRGDPRGELIQVQCRLAAAVPEREDANRLRRRERALVKQVTVRRPAWAAEWPPAFSRGFATRLVVTDLDAFKASAVEIVRAHPLAELELAGGTKVAARPDGAYLVVIERDVNQGGSPSGGWHVITTVATVLDRAGKVVHEERRRWESSYSNSSEYEGGETIDGAWFDGDAAVLRIVGGQDVRIPLAA
jgi:uncharacterized protein (TIGR02996 family)